MNGDDFLRRQDVLGYINLNAWKHEGDDSYSKGMDAGARHQVQAIYDAIRALPAASAEDVRAEALDPATLEAVARMFDAIGNDAPMKGYECAKAVRGLIVEATANDLGWNELPENWEG